MFQAIRKEKSGSELTSYFWTHPDDHTTQTTDTPGFKPFTLLSYFWLSGVSEHLMMFLKVPQLSAVTVQVATSDLVSICYTCQTDQRDVLTITQTDE